MDYHGDVESGAVFFFQPFHRTTDLLFVHQRFLDGG